MLLRIEKFLNRSTTLLEIQFSEELSPTIGISNISIISEINNVPGLTVRAVAVTDNILQISTSPQFPFAFYRILFISTSSQDFESTSGNSLQEDGVNNAISFLGLEDINPVRDDLFGTVSPVYNLEEPTVVRDVFSNGAERLYSGRNDIRETGNANYIDVEIVDELRRRGYSATDRLGNEGAYKVTRVATTATGANTAARINFNSDRAVSLLGVTNSSRVNTQITSFPSDPFSLRSTDVIRERVSNSEDVNNSFEDTVITLSNNNIAQIHSVVLKRTGQVDLVYDLPANGYSIQNNRYDTTYAKTLLTLESNQFRIPDAAIFAGEFEVPTGTDVVEVSYSYIHNGINADGDTIAVTQVIPIVRQSVPAFFTIFSLGNFPIVTASDEIPSIGGVSFLDPNPATGSPFTVAHPAFINEIVFSESRLPAAEGEFAVDYATGQVYVYGATTNDGTGSAPPVASYSYRKIFVQGVDYDFEPDADEVSANVTRDLIGEEVKLTFEYEQVLAEGSDYLILTHQEVIDEAVENNFYAPNEITPLNNPITNVFRVFNSTTGENYVLRRFSDTSMFIEGRNLPRIEKVENEVVSFERITNAALNITEDITITGSYKIVRIDLSHNSIMSEDEKFIGSHINSSVLFSDTTIFLREFYYDNVLQSVGTNLAKLSVNGDYLVNYEDGVVYVRLASDVDDVGEISYTYGAIRTNRPRILSVDEIGYRQTIRTDTIQAFEAGSFTSELIFPSNLPHMGERFLLGDVDKPILFGAKQYGVAGQRNVSSTTFVALDALFDSSHADGNHIIRFPDDSDRAILQVLSSTSVVVDVAFTDTERSVGWCLVDFNTSDGYDAITSYDILNVRGVYSVTELQSLDRDSLTNYWDPELDTFDQNKITFNNTLVPSLSAGDALMIDYSYGNLYVNYDQLFDNLIISYEYGDNSLDFSIGTGVRSGQDYFVTYNFGALREALLANFGSLTQLDELTTFPLDTDRELYRDAVKGALQSFLRGPTVESVENIVSSITDVTPDVRELTFDEWTLSRDNLYLQAGKLEGTEQYISGKFNDGLVIRDTTRLQFPAEAYISFRGGTFHSWIIPDWRGLDNDATLTFDIGQDGYSAIAGNGLADGYRLSFEDIYIGESAYNPTEMPFSITRFDVDPVATNGRPSNYGQAPGYFIWYDSDANEWKVRFVANPQNLVRFTGEITTSGQFYNVRDGYNTTTGLFVNELNDTKTSTYSYINFDTTIDLIEGLDGYDGYIGIDGYDGYGNPDGYFSQDGFDFLSDDLHYIFDSGPSLTHNRLSLFKDGLGYLNFRAYDSSGQLRPGTARMYNISHDISSWAAGDLHFVSTAWRFNSAQGIDEMHLFVDGQEVSNNFKYGGRPRANHGQDIFRTVADEYVTTSATKTVVGVSAGVTTASSAVVTSATASFISTGVIAGDTVHILDSTADGAGSPYTILTVDSEEQITLTASLLLSLTNVSFAVNQITYNAETNINTEKIAVFRQDGYGITELNGVGADSPDYTVARSGPNNVLTINNNVNKGDSVYINTLGLTKGRVRDVHYTYSVDNILRTNLAPPAENNHVDIYKYIFYALRDDGYSVIGGEGFVYNGTTMDGYFTTDICQPSNTVVGKTLRVTLHGTMDIDFTGTNTVTIEGAPSTEVLTFTDYGSQVSTTLFTSVVSLDFTFTPGPSWDGYTSVGAVEVIEDIPLTQSENSGDYAIVASYNNGEFTLHEFGSGGAPFNLESCYYLLDYPIALNITMNRKGSLYLGSDLSGANQLDGVLDEVFILNEMLTDIRAGEVPPSTQRTVTQDYNSIAQLTQTPQTMMMLHLDGDLNNIETFYNTYDEAFLTTSNSVNVNFGDAGVFENNVEKNVYLIDNGPAVFNNNEGAVEFWISPMIDILNDMDHTRYYIDVVAAQTVDVTSTTAITLFLPRRARKVESVRLISDDGTGTDYFVGGELGIDGTTVRLGQRLPSQRTLVRVNYVPIDLQGDRVSIYKDGYGTLNFEILASEQVYQIAAPIAWQRNTWHRVLATWDLNNLDNQDRMRLFIDGQESGTILYGTPGLLYGIGILYGSSSVLASNFLTTNVDLLDTFSDILVGNNRDGTGAAMARIDNLRFSNAVREPSVVAGVNIDINYNANTDAALPVIEDDLTTLLLDFDKDISETQFLANGLRKATPLFLFDVDVIDSFNRITGDADAQQLIESLIDRLKPTHTQSFVRFL